MRASRSSYDAGAGLIAIAGDVDGDGVADLVITASGDHRDFTGFTLRSCSRVKPTQTHFPAAT